VNAQTRVRNATNSSVKQTIGNLLDETRAERLLWATYDKKSLHCTTTKLANQLDQVEWSQPQERALTNLKDRVLSYHSWRRSGRPC
jgi:hypothetical protein